MNERQREYFNSNRLIPFCTHDDVIRMLDKKHMEALAFITFMASSTDFEAVYDVFGSGCAEIEDKNLHSCKIKKRSEISINGCSKYFGKHRNTITNYLNYLEHVRDFSNYLYVNGIGEELLQIEYEENDTIYRLNHKAIDNRYYTVLESSTLKKLMELNGTSIKLYLIIKINYENCKRKNKPCILDMEFLSREIGLSSISQISKTLEKMDNVVIKRKLKYKITNDLNKKNTPKSLYEYEII